jgi:hypothetical protein
MKKESKENLLIREKINKFAIFDKKGLCSNEFNSDSFINCMEIEQEN